jgi:hypothetical protein
MIQTRPGDMVRVAANSRFYYAIVLSKVRLFGGQVCFIPYKSSPQPMDPQNVLKSSTDGLFEIVDFICAKRENRIERIATKLDIGPWDRRMVGFKNTHATKEKAKDWWIYDRDGKELRRVQRLTGEERRYPLLRRIDDVVMVRLVDQRWCPEDDKRI